MTLSIRPLTLREANAYVALHHRHNKPVVGHIDGNNQNNSYTNLEWVTNMENVWRRQDLIDEKRR